jgi:hypothetical protein
MAVIEYMLHRINGSSRAEIPGWVGDRGHWFNSADNTYIGWIDDVRDYYVPDTVVALTKAELVARQLAIHATTPFMNLSDNPGEEPVAMTDAEVTAMVEAWYDDFVAKNSA